MKRRRFACQLTIFVLIAVLLPVLAFAGVPTEWVRILDSPYKRFDYIQHMVSDAAGNVYVTGGSGGPPYVIATVKYDPDGNQLWENRYGEAPPFTYSPVDIQVDNAGNVYVAGWGGGTTNDPTGHDVLTLKLDPTGNLLWDRYYDGSAGEYDRASALDVDASGNVHVAGVVRMDASDYGYVTLKYDPSGTLLWDRTYSGPGTGWEDPTAVAVDDNGNVVVTGVSKNILNLTDYATLMYDAAGTLLWERRYDGPPYEDDKAIGLGIDTLGNVYVTGTSDGAAHNTDIATVKYAPDGTILWTQRYDGGTFAGEKAQTMQVDPAGNVLIAATGSRAMGLDPECVFLKYDNAGTLVREQHFAKAANGQHGVLAMAFDAAENAYVTGSVPIAENDSDILTVKYDVSGTKEWEKQYSGPAGLHDVAYALAIDPTGNVLVAGVTYQEGVNADYITLKYGTADCTCPYRGDFDGSGFIDAVDLSLYVEVVFFGGADFPDPDCPRYRADFNADGFSDAIDLSQLIDHVFFGGTGPADPCGP